MSERPDRISYYLGEAIAVASRAACTGFRVGAVLVLEDRVISSGYNGTPENFRNCTDGECLRCADSARFGGSGNGYDKCICVHAEMNAIASAARYGMATNKSVAYVTHQPCITCAKELVQAGIERVYYMIELPVRDQDPEVDAALRKTHENLMRQLRATPVDPKRVVTDLAKAMERFEEDKCRANKLATASAAAPSNGKARRTSQT